jgi:hypothetical protein
VEAERDAAQAEAVAARAAVQHLRLLRGRGGAIIMIEGWYYLHTNGDLIYKRELGETAADIRESSFARARMGTWISGEERGSE